MEAGGVDLQGRWWQDPRSGDLPGNNISTSTILSTVGCVIPFPGGGIYLPGFGVVGALYSTSCVSYDSHATTTKHAAAALTMAQKPHHDESVLAAFSANPCQLPLIRR